MTLYIILSTSGAGTFFALKISDWFSQEQTYVNVILSDDKSAMIALQWTTFHQKKRVDFLKRKYPTGTRVKDVKHDPYVKLLSETKVAMRRVENIGTLTANVSLAG